ncbi:thioredoxin domain-containing protein [Okibacterium endophyticum]
MAHRLENAISPYLRAHASNPVDWWPWGPEAFAEAARLDVPVFISIGYATCHWCHVMARESFSDERVAAYLAEHFVSIKVDREEHPDVDATYLAQASAFTRQLGWPLSVFTTPQGRAFYAGTYFPPVAAQGHPSFSQVLEAVTDAWQNRRDEAMHNGEAIAEAVLASSAPRGEAELPSRDALDEAATALASHEDPVFGGFGGSPKFPVAPTLMFLQAMGGDAEVLAARTLERMADSPLRDPVEGGFFRYATKRDWSDPHYERMLYDNALLLGAYTAAWTADDSRHWAARTAAGIASFLIEVMQRPSGGYASAQDSESIIDGRRSEGGYYARDALGRSTLQPPALDEKILTGWNGMAVEAMARAGRVFAQPGWIDSARRAADYLLEVHVDDERMLTRASIAAPGESGETARRSEAVATLEDYGMLAGALIELALATGESRYALEARRFIDATLVAGEAQRTVRSGGGAARGGSEQSGAEQPEPLADVFVAPGGGDPVLVSHRLLLEGDPSEGAYPSGQAATASAAWRLYLLIGERRYLAAAAAVVGSIAELALANPVSFGSALALAASLAREPRQLVVVTPDDAAGAGELADVVRRAQQDVTAVVTQSEAQRFAAGGFGLFEAREPVDGQATAYACTAFVCSLPVTDADGLENALAR